MHINKINLKKNSLNIGIDLEIQAGLEVKHRPPPVNILPPKSSCGDFPGGPVIKNSPAYEEDTISIPGPGSFHMPWGN